MAPEAVAKSLTGLPLEVVGPVDIGRLIRELEAVDNALMQLELRKEGDIKLPKTSRLLDKTAEMNHLNLLVKSERAQALQLLTTVRDRAPVLHISFSADPSPLFTQKLMTWLRTEIHPVVLLTIGLQPNLGAGCVVRTTNKLFDLSLRQDFAEKIDVLLAALRKEPEMAATPPAVATVSATAAPAPAPAVAAAPQPPQAVAA